MNSVNKMIFNAEQEIISHLPLKREVQGSDGQDSADSAAAPPSEKPAGVNQNEGPNQTLRPVLQRFPAIRNGAVEHEYFVMKDEITRLLLQKGLDHFEISLSHWGYEMSTALPCLEIILNEKPKNDVGVELHEIFRFWKCEHLKRMICFRGTVREDQTRNIKEIEKVGQSQEITH
jgi:hypothetical protein